MCFFSTKAFLISAIIIAKIIYLGFLVSYASGVALVMRISRVLGLLRSSIVYYTVSYSALGLVLSIELVLNLGLGSLNILFIVEYQFSWYLYILSLSFYLVYGSAVVKISSYSLV